MWTRWVGAQWTALCHSNPVDHHGSSAPFLLTALPLDRQASRSQHETTGGTESEAGGRGLLPWSGRAPESTPGDPSPAGRVGGVAERGQRV